MCMDACCSPELLLIFLNGGKGKEERCETTVETQKVYVLRVAITLADGEA